ncbi:dihydrodipicolinate synthase family protein [Hirschia litorea]|uniref:Dihydrodipicolinate synthase family protein n=1 Tax=Hirschia litorea TaxID=1199156 RepID=A0ABW2IPY0_9PROT
MNKDFSGVLPVVPTPFTDDNKVDHTSLANVVKFAISAEASALVYPGVASEDIQLSAEERAACMATVVEANEGRLPIIAGVNSNDAPVMVEMASLMSSLGATGIMAMAVPSMAEKGFEHWFQKISDATGGLPIVLQNLFAPRGADLSAEEMLDLSEKVEAIRFVKEEGIPSGPKVTAISKGVGKSIDAVIGGGGARYVFEELERGAIATMPAIELLELHVALVKAYQAGKRNEALALYGKSLPILLMQAPYRMRLTKLILKHRGIFQTDHVRENLPILDDISKKLILEMYENLELTKDTIDA